MPMLKTAGLKTNLLARSSNPPKNKKALEQHFVQLVQQNAEGVIEGAKKRFYAQIDKIVKESLRQVFSCHSTC